MLTHLYIKNYALIEELQIDWHQGLSVITGETGAGKSILLGAINLLTGQRADSKNIQAGASKCIVEATFNIEQYSLQEFFEDNDLDFDSNECIIRREVMENGKSRAFVNDCPTTLNVLKELCHHLIDIHSQHQNLLLGEEDYQLHILDIIAKHQPLMQEYKELFHTYKEDARKLEEAKRKLEKSKADEDYLCFQLEQLEGLKLVPNEEEQLEQEQSELTHAEDIMSALFQVNNLFYNEIENGGVLCKIRQIKQILQSLNRIYPNITDYEERVENALIELRDIKSDLSDIAEKIEFNPQRLEEIENRLDTIYTLEKKHGVENVEELISLTEKFRQQLDNINNGDDQLLQLSKQIVDKEKELMRLAINLSENRTRAAEEIQKQIVQSLTKLDMPNIVFKVEINKREHLTENGLDNVTFLFSANKNTPPQPISKVASGGEIARVMLTLKSITSKSTNLPTIVFDEIDTGISGKVADSMAMMMEEMGKGEKHQVITITHLPQIASYGTSHYYVYKEDSTGQTVSHIKELNQEERVHELAHMLSGSTITDAAIENAKQLLKK